MLRLVVASCCHEILASDLKMIMLDLAQVDRGKYKICLKIDWAQMEAVGRKKF